MHIRLEVEFIKRTKPIIMKTISLFFGFFLFIAVVTNAQFSGGTGTTVDPFQIATKADLETLSHNPAYWDKHFIQTADIVFSSADFQKGGAFYNGGAGFSPIGNSKIKFTGSYNGQGHSIDSLYINRPTQDDVGFFGNIISSITQIDSLGLTNVNITGHNTVGGFCAENNGTITNCFATGSVSGTNYIGGFCGWNDGDINKSYATGRVSSEGYGVGGFCGFNNEAICKCYATGRVYGTSDIGGFCGWNNGRNPISKCYATGSVSGNESVGGFCGLNYEVISNCYAKGKVSGTNDLGGFCGFNDRGIISNCFWNIQTSGLTKSSGGTGKTTVEMKNRSTFTDATWDFTYIWQMSYCINNGYPGLRVFGLLNTIPNSNSSSNLSVTACHSYSSPSGKYRWTTSGIYMDRIPNATGCDSVIIVNLTIQSVSDITTSLKDNTITANNANASYQWLDCDDNYAVIPNETGRSFTPASVGHYAVELSENGCVDTSDCVAITTLGVSEKSFEEELIAYPNPTNGDFTIDLGKEYSEVQMSITDITGKTLQTKRFTQVHLIKLTLPLEASGVYFVLLRTKYKNAVIRVIKE